MFQAVDLFLQLRPRLRDVNEQEDGWVKATLDYEAADSTLKELLTELHNDGVISELRSDESRVFPPNFGESRPLELTIDLGHLPGYFETHHALVQRFPDSPPEEYCVWQKSQDFETGYQTALSLLSLLKGKAEVWDSTQQRFYLVDQQAIEISLIYEPAETAALPGIVPDVIRFLDSGHLDADTRWVFFRKASIRMLRDIAKERRLGFLFEKLANIFDRSQQDYSLYLERFSFEDLLKNFDEKRLKFVGDLNQILGSIQTALIAVPIGFFLVAEKFEPASGVIGQNVVLAAGGLVFCGILFVLSSNQGKTLRGVKLAITAFEAEQRKKVTDTSIRLQEVLSSTWDQYKRVRLLLWVVRGLLFLFSVVIIAALLWCSIPSWQQRLPYLPTSPSTPTALVRD